MTELVVKIAWLTFYSTRDSNGSRDFLGRVVHISNPQSNTMVSAE